MDVQRQYLCEEEPRSLGITQQKPKHPMFAVITKRLESFANWPEHMPVAADELAECGFVYTGVGDSVRCYYCGGGLKSWEAGDDPWVEHSTWYPECPHILLNKGQNFIDRVSDSESLDSDGPLIEETPQANGYLDTAAAQSCIQMGYSEEKVQRAIEKYIALHGHSNFKGQNLCEIVLDEEDGICATNVTDSTRTMSTAAIENVKVLEPVNTMTSEQDEHESMDELYEENCRLKDNQKCKICLDAVASIIFLPCGHMVTCPQCAPAFTMCPICRMEVNGFIKAYFACS